MLIALMNMKLEILKIISRKRSLYDARGVVTCHHCYVLTNQPEVTILNPPVLTKLYLVEAMHGLSLGVIVAHGSQGFQRAAGLIRPGIVETIGSTNQIRFHIVGIVQEPISCYVTGCTIREKTEKQYPVFVRW
jgi:hypothetical protein